MPDIKQKSYLGIQLGLVTISIVLFVLVAALFFDW